jgi:ketosteroid isomerase-like protein
MPSGLTVTESPETSPRTIVGKYFRVWNEGDPSVLADLLAPDWVDHAHPDRHSPGDVARAILEAREGHPDMRVYLDAILGDERRVTVNGRVSSAGHTDNLVWIVRVEDGRMQEMWTYSAD